MNNLPAELTLHIASFCSIRDTVVLLSCDRALHVYMSFEPLWHDAYTRDFGCAYVNGARSVIEGIRAIYVDLGAYATIAWRPDWEMVRHGSVHHEAIKQRLVPLRSLLETIYHEHGFAAAATVVKNIDYMLGHVTQQLSKFMIRLVRDDLYVRCVAASAADAATRAAAFIDNVTYEPVVKKMAVFVAKLLREERRALARTNNEGDDSINQLHAIYNVRRYYTNCGLYHHSDNDMISKVLDLV